MPQTFASTYDLFNQMQNTGALPKDMGLPEFSRYANQLTGTNEFDEGERGGFGGLVSKGSYWLDKGLQQTGAPQYLGEKGADLFESLGGSRATGQAVGEGFPRGAIDAASFFVPGLGEANAGARLGIAAGMMGAHAYADTGKALPTAVAAASPFLMKFGGEAAGELADTLGLTNAVPHNIPELGITGAPTGNLVTQHFLEGFGDKATNFAAHQIGAIGTMEATNYASDAIQNKTWNPYEGQSFYDRLLSTTVGNFPYMLGGAYGLVDGKPQAFGKPSRIEIAKPTTQGADIPTAAVDDQQARENMIRARSSQGMAQAISMPMGSERDMWLAGAKDAPVQNLWRSENLEAFDPFTMKLPDMQKFNEQFGNTPESKAPLDLAQQAGANPAIPEDMMNAWATAPALTVDQVRDPVKLTQVHNDTQEMVKAAPEIRPSVDENPVVMAVLDNAGTPPDEAVIAAKVGERNNQLNRIQRAPQRDQEEITNDQTSTHVSDLSGDELQRMTNQRRESDQNIDETVLGTEGAKKWRLLQRKENSTDTKIADAAFAEREKMEAALTEEQRNQLYGVGDQGLSHETLKDITDAVQRVENAHEPSDIVQALKFQIPHLDKNPESPQQVKALAAFKAAERTIRKNGWDSKEIQKQLAHEFAARFSDVNDAADIWKGVFGESGKIGGRGINNVKLQDGKNSKYEGKVTKDTTDFNQVAQDLQEGNIIHTDPVKDKTLKDSVQVLMSSLRNVSDKEATDALYSQWGNWRDRLLSPEKMNRKQAKPWSNADGSKRDPIEVLKGMLGRRVQSEQGKEDARKVIEPIKKSSDPDKALAGSAMDDVLSELQLKHDLPDTEIEKLRNQLSGSDADKMEAAKTLLRLNDRYEKGPEEGQQSDAMAKDTTVPFVEGAEGVLHDTEDEAPDREELQSHDEDSDFIGASGENMFGTPKLLPQGTDVFGRILRKQGFSEPEISTWSKWLESIKSLFNIKGLQMGELINDDSRWVAAGLAQKDMRRILLAKSLYGGDSGAHQLGVTLAHELGHIISGMADRNELPQRFNESISGLKTFIDTQTPAAMEFLNMLHEQLPADYRDLGIWDQRLANTNTEEIFANMMSAWALNKIDGDNGRAFGLMVAPEAHSWLKSISEYTRRILGAVKGMLWTKPDMGKDLMQPSLDSITKTFDGLTKALREGEMAMNDLQQMAIIGSSDNWVMRTSEMTNNYSPQEYGQDDLRKIADIPYTATKQTGTLENTYNNFIRGLHDIGQGYPHFREVVARITNHAGEMRALHNEIMAPIVGEANALTGDVSARGPKFKSWRSLHADVDQNANDLHSEITQWLQQPGIDAKVFVPDGQGGWINNVRQVLMSDNPTWPPGSTSGHKLGDALKSAKPKIAQAIMDDVAKNVESSKVAMQQRVDAELEQRRGQMKIFLGLKDATKFSQADAIVRQFTDAVDKSMADDQATKWQGGREMEVARDKIGNDENYQQMIDMWMHSRQDVQQIQDSFKPSHYSMIRQGRYLVSATTASGARYTDAINDLGKTYEKWKSLRKSEGFTNIETPVEKDQLQFAISPGDTQLQTIKLIEDRNKEQFNQMLTSLNAPQDIIDAYGKMGGTLSDVARIMNAGDIQTTAGYKQLVGGGERKTTPGSMDMIQTQLTAGGVMSRLNATKRMSSHVAFELMNPELQRFPAELKQVKAQLQAYMQPDSQLQRQLAKFNSVMYLAGNIPSHLMYLAQNWMTPLAEAVSRGWSPVKATVNITRSAIDVGKLTLDLMKSKLGLTQDHLRLDSLKDPEERELFKWMSAQGLRSVGNVMGQFGAGSSYGATDMNRATAGVSKKWYQAVTTPVNVMADQTMKIFSAVHHFNQDVAALTGFRQAREQAGAGYNRQAAFESARDFMRSSVFNAGRANRPVMESKMGVLGSTAYSLQHWTLGWLNQLTRYTTHWRGAEYLDLTPTQRNNARRAALTMLGTQFAAAGALGMPFVGAALTVLEKVTGKSVTGNMYAALQKQLDDDSKDGGGLANVIMNGGANALLANAGLPVDMGSRMAVGGVLGISPQDGFSGDAVFGPSAQIVSNVVAGLKSAASGDFSTAANQLAPSSVKKAIALWKNGGQIATSGGEVVPDDPKHPELVKAAYALGFNPQSLSKLQQYSNYKKQLDSSLQIQHKQEAQGILQTLQDNPDDAQRQLVELSQKSGRPIQEIGEEIAKTAAQHAFPEDIREGLNPENADTSMAMARGIGVDIPQAHEVAKQTYMNNMLGIMGIRQTRLNVYAMERDELGQQYEPMNQFSRPRH